MRKTGILATAILGGALLFAPAAPAAETEAGASVGLYSNYVFRGQTLSDDWVVQPAVGLSWNGLGLAAWANYDSDTKELNETDFTLNFANSVNRLSYDAGVIYYGLDGIEDTTEFYLTLGYDVILSPYATLYWDVDEGDGGFLVLGIGHSFPVTDTIGIDLGADVTVNFDNAVLGVDEEGDTFTDFYNADLSVGTSIPFAGAWSLDVLLAYSFALTDASKAAISDLSVDGEKDVFWGGASLSLAF